MQKKQPLFHTYPGTSRSHLKGQCPHPVSSLVIDRFHIRTYMEFLLHTGMRNIRNEALDTSKMEPHHLICFRGQPCFCSSCKGSSDTEHLVDLVTFSGQLQACLIIHTKKGRNKFFKNPKIINKKMLNSPLFYFFTFPFFSVFPLPSAFSFAAYKQKVVSTLRSRFLG